MPTINAVLFDLDGTLLDTAADLSAAMNVLLTRYNFPTIPIAELTPHISQGSTGMLQKSFNLELDDPRFNDLRQQFFDIYRAQIKIDTQPFPGIEEFIEQIVNHGLAWGVVTNKPEWLAKPLLNEFVFAQSTGCVIGGDTLGKAKPNPEPLWYACGLLNQPVAHCIYVGDAKRDIEAGNRAGMRTVIAKYGYIPHDEDLNTWEATQAVDSVYELMDFVFKG